MRTIVMGLKLGICSEEEKCAKKQVLIGYLLKHLKVNITLHNISYNYREKLKVSFSNNIVQRHKLYMVRYFVCEALCLVNIVIQLCLMNKFFDGEFLSYGWRVMSYSDLPQEQRLDPMVYVFPRYVNL